MLQLIGSAGPAAGPDPEPMLQQLEDPISDQSRSWDREHDEHVACKLLDAIEQDFQPATWQAFRRVVLDNHEPEAVALEELKRTHEAAGRTLAEVSQRCGIDEPARSRLANGHNTNPTLDWLAFNWRLQYG